MKQRDVSKLRARSAGRAAGRRKAVETVSVICFTQGPEKL